MAISLLLAAVLVVFLPVASGVHFTYPVLFMFGAMALLLSEQKPLPLFSLPDRLGDSSYSLYLFHPFVAPAAVLAVSRLLPSAGAGWHLLAVMAFTIAACHALHLGVEAPLVRWARRWLIGRPLDGRMKGERAA